MLRSNEIKNLFKKANYLEAENIMEILGMAGTFKKPNCHGLPKKMIMQRLRNRS